jgi:hypothetical protein
LRFPLLEPIPRRPALAVLPFSHECEVLEVDELGEPAPDGGVGDVEGFADLAP